MTTPTEAQISKMLCALLECSASDLESYSPKMLDGYTADVTRVFAAIHQPEIQMNKDSKRLIDVAAPCSNPEQMEAIYKLIGNDPDFASRFFRSLEKV